MLRRLDPSPPEARFEAQRRTAFVTGASGYLGRALCAALLARGHRVRALVRPGSSGAVVAGCDLVQGDALDARTFAGRIAPADTLVPLVGVRKPSPGKEREFETVDGASLAAALDAAQGARVRHIVYVSVAQPAPVMKAYARVRAGCEARLRSCGIPSTILRPWYVLGPGHRWPILLRPLYWLAERMPGSSASARRLGLVTLEEMVTALVWAVEHPSPAVRVLDVPAIRRGGVGAPSGTHGEGWTPSP